MTKIRNVDTEDTDAVAAFEKFRAKRRKAVTTKTLEEKLSELSASNERLSKTNLLLSNFLRTVMAHLPQHLKDEYERLKKLADLEVHP